jgi:hypothetical protein
MIGSMKRLLIPCLALVMVGCNPAEHTATPEEPTKPVATTPAPQAQTTPPPVNQAAPAPQGGSDIQIHGMGAGAATPVTGGTSLDGGGSGVGQAAKDQARRVAGSAGSSSLGQMNDEPSTGN